MSLIDIVDDAAPTDNSAEAEPVAQTLDDAVPSTSEPVEANPEPDSPAESDVPEKYRGKSTAEIIQMHQNAESLIGKNSSEVGELRNIVDEFIKNQHTSQSTNSKDDDEEDEIDFLDDPAAAVNRLVENHPAVKAAKETATTVEQERVLKSIQKKYPDMGETLGSSDFLDWVGKSEYRTRTFRKANDNYDAEAADEIFGTWAELRTANPAPKNDEVTETVKAAQKQNIVDAQTGAVQQGAGESKKIYRASDIRNLIITDRSRYEELQDEITLAYREGRVR